MNSRREHQLNKLCTFILAHSYSPINCVRFKSPCPYIDIGGLEIRKRIRMASKFWRPFDFEDDSDEERKSQGVYADLYWRIEFHYVRGLK